MFLYDLDHTDLYLKYNFHKLKQELKLEGTVSVKKISRILPTYAWTNMNLNFFQDYDFTSVKGAEMSGISLAKSPARCVYLL